MFATSFLLAAGIVWSGVTSERHLGGRPASPGYLQGKVILVDCRDYSCDRAALERLEDFWRCYKVKPFVLVGSHRGGAVGEAKRNLEAAGVSFPVYADAAFEAKTFAPENGLIYVIDHGGRMAIKTRDVNRAFEAAVNAMTWGAVPSDSRQFGRIIDYELGVLPGQAYNHLKAMRRELPDEARRAYADEFAKLDADAEVKGIARIEEVVRNVKDFDPNSRRNGRRVQISRRKVEDVIAAAESFRRSANPLVVQEAKNCIAELKWVLAEM